MRAMAEAQRFSSPLRKELDPSHSAGASDAAGIGSEDHFEEKGLRRVRSDEKLFPYNQVSQTHTHHHHHHHFFLLTTFSPSADISLLAPQCMIWARRISGMGWKTEGRLGTASSFATATAAAATGVNSPTSPPTARYRTPWSPRQCSCPSMAPIPRPQRVPPSLLIRSPPRPLPVRLPSPHTVQITPLPTTRRACWQ